MSVSQFSFGENQEGNLKMYDDVFFFFLLNLFVCSEVFLPSISGGYYLCYI